MLYWFVCGRLFHSILTFRSFHISLYNTPRSYADFIPCTESLMGWIDPVFLGPFQIAQGFLALLPHPSLFLSVTLWPSHSPWSTEAVEGWARGSPAESYSTVCRVLPPVELCKSTSTKMWAAFKEDSWGNGKCCLTPEKSNLEIAKYFHLISNSKQQLTEVNIA